MKKTVKVVRRPTGLLNKSFIPRLFWAGFLFIPLFSACRSVPSVDVRAAAGEETLRALMNTAPLDGKPVFLGVAGVRSRMKDSVNLALEEAARRAAIFGEVEGEFTALSSKGGRLLDYRAESTSFLRYDPDYKKHLESLEFNGETDVFRSENAVFVRVRFPGSLELDYPPFPRGPDGKPAWIENPPARIGDYAAGVGYAGRRNAHRDTVNASYENAAFVIIGGLYGFSWGESLDRRGDGFFDSSFTAREGFEAKGVLHGFYALETWTDPKDKSVWTLAVAKGRAVE